MKETVAEESAGVEPGGQDLRETEEGEEGAVDAGAARVEMSGWSGAGMKEVPELVRLEPGGGSTVGERRPVRSKPPPPTTTWESPVFWEKVHSERELTEPSRRFKAPPPEEVAALLEKETEEKDEVEEEDRRMTPYRVWKLDIEVSDTSRCAGSLEEETEIREEGGMAEEVMWKVPEGSGWRWPPETVAEVMASVDKTHSALPFSETWPSTTRLASVRMEQLPERKLAIPVAWR